MGNIPEVCTSCKANLFEYLCKECDYSYYCKDCFDASHKNYKRKNHIYYVLRGKDKHDTKFKSNA